MEWRDLGDVEDGRRGGDDLEDGRIAALEENGGVRADGVGADGGAWGV